MKFLRKYNSQAEYSAATITDRPIVAYDIEDVHYMKVSKEMPVATLIFANDTGSSHFIYSNSMTISSLSDTTFSKDEVGSGLSAFICLSADTFDFYISIEETRDYRYHFYLYEGITSYDIDDDLINSLYNESRIDDAMKAILEKNIGNKLYQGVCDKANYGFSLENEKDFYYYSLVKAVDNNVIVEYDCVKEGGLKTLYLLNSGATVEQVEAGEECNIFNNETVDKTLEVNKRNSETYVDEGYITVVGNCTY